MLLDSPALFMFRDTQLLLLSNQREPTAIEENKFWALGCLNKSYTVTALDDMKTWIKELSQGPTPTKRSRQFMARERETVFSRDKFLIGYPIPSSQP